MHYTWGQKGNVDVDSVEIFYHSLWLTHFHATSYKYCEGASVVFELLGAMF